MRPGVEPLGDVRTRFVATDTGTYLVGASTISPSFAWYGRLADGSEAQLTGTLPITLAVSASSGPLDPASPSFTTLHATTTLSFTSAGLRAVLPVKILKPAKWTLDVSIVVGTKKPPNRYNVVVRALDERGTRFDGVTCSITTSLNGVAETPITQCTLYNVGKQKAPPPLHASRVLDRVCATVLDQTVCKPIPD